MSNAAITARYPAQLPAGFSGAGFFLGAGDMVGDHVHGVKRLLDAGATTSFVLIESVEGTRQPASRVRDVCIAHRERDIEPWLFTFPTCARIDSAVDHVIECGQLANVKKVVLDLEPYRDPKSGRLYDWTERDIADLVTKVRAAGFEIAITVFTRKAWSRIAWDRIAPGVPILLQVYERVADEDELAAAIAQWPGRTVVLCLATYLGPIERLRHDLANARAHSMKVGACAFWKLGSTDLAEARTVCSWIVSI